MTETLLHATPYDISATGIYFEDWGEYKQRTSRHKNHYGERVEEFELQFIDGERLDRELFEALGVNQANLKAFFDIALHWEEWEKILVILGKREASYIFNLEEDQPEQLEIDVYHVDSLRELAEDFVKEGLFGEIPDSIVHFIDLDAIAYDLSMEYGETVINGQTIIYRCR